MGQDSLWIAGLLLWLIITIVVGVPVSKILRKAGYSPWWTILIVISVCLPPLTLIPLWIFAFARWPAIAHAPSEPAA